MRAVDLEAQLSQQQTLDLSPREAEAPTGSKRREQ